MGKSILDLPKEKEMVGYHVVIKGTASPSMVQSSGDQRQDWARSGSL